MQKRGKEGIRKEERGEGRVGVEVLRTDGVEIRKRSRIGKFGRRRGMYRYYRKGRILGVTRTVAKKKPAMDEDTACKRASK